MTALAANTALSLRNGPGSTEKRINGVIATGAVIYHHALVQMNAAGLLEPATDNATASFFGIADITRPTGSGGLTGVSGGTVNVDCIYDVEALLPCVTTTTVGLGFCALFCADDNTLSDSVTQGPQAGILMEIPAANTVWCAIRKAAVAKGT